MEPSLQKWFTYALIAVALVVATAHFTRWSGLVTDNVNEAQGAIQYRTCGIDDLPEQLRPLHSNKFALVVVGDGVKDASLAATRPYSSNYAQGWDLYEGVAHAAEKPTFKEISTLVDIVYVDDGGDSLCSALISKEIMKSPRVIAVIGHATTGTTKVALENYKRANIPTIIPIATNPDLTVNCPNCFRLPSNDAIQAKVLADYAANVLKGRNIYLVWDGTDSAREYSEFLQSAVVNLLGSKIKFKQPIAFRPMNYEHLLKSISYNKTDVLIFCGYGSMAREFLNGLRFEYIGKELLLKKPIVLLSDGARISDIEEVSSEFGFETYLSFPSDKLGAKEQFRAFNALTPPREEEGMKLEESYELFGYDSLGLFSLAFKRMIKKGEISRRLLNESLAFENPPSSDLCYTYKFENGDNVNARYFVYSVGTDSVDREYDGSYLTSVFTDKPTPNLIGRFDDIETIDSQLLDKVVSQLANEAGTKALILISYTDEVEKATEHTSRLLTYLLKGNKLEPSRFGVVLRSTGKTKTPLTTHGQLQRQRTEIWVIPEGSPPPVPDKNITDAREFLKNLQLRTSRNR